MNTCENEAEHIGVFGTGRLAQQLKGNAFQPRPFSQGAVNQLLNEGPIFRAQGFEPLGQCPDKRFSAMYRCQDSCCDGSTC